MKITKGKIVFIIVFTVYIINLLIYINFNGWPYLYSPSEAGANGIFIGVSFPFFTVFCFIALVHYITDNW